ncbi:MAG: hypothetical protein FJ254_05495 [Phycisphaerae bacterium]|nr:hypothetical protein [Phycisphaerae bacterium]
MTVPPTRDELLELAELDALGALEPAEQARFERGLRDASPTLRAELHAVQDAAVLDPIGMCDVEPEAGLKYKVMARIADAVTASETELAPIASIGRPAAPQRVAPIAAPAPATVSLPAPAPLAPAASAATTRDADVLERVTQAAEQTELERLRAMLDRARNHGYMLRAACIALASCLVVAGYALARQDSYAKEVTIAAISASSREDLKALLGPSVEPFLRDGIPSTALSGAAPSSTGGVIVWADPVTGSAFLAMVGLDASRKFELVARDAGQGTDLTIVATGVKAHGPLSGMLLEQATDLIGRIIELRDPNTGTVLYRGQLR